MHLSVCCVEQLHIRCIRRFHSVDAVQMNFRCCPNRQQLALHVQSGLQLQDVYKRQVKRINEEAYRKWESSSAIALSIIEESCDYVLNLSALRCV